MKNKQTQITECLHIYARVSSAEQIKGHSLDVQVKKGIEMAKTLGYTYEVYREEGKSANYEDTINRPELTKILNKAKLGEVRHIFITDIDRLTRNLRLVLDIERILLEHEITIHTLSARLDMEDPDQRFQTIMQSVFSEHENRKRVRKIQLSLKQAADKGRWIGINVPFGYRKGYDGIIEPDPDEKETYLKIVKMTLQGMGTNTIAKDLNRSLIQTKGSKVLKKGIRLPKTEFRYEPKFIRKEDLKWAPNVIRGIIINPIYKGERNYKGETIYAPAIIDSNTWDRLQLIHKNNKNHSSTATKYFYLLRNMLRCGHCGRNLAGRIKPKSNEYYYQCSSKRQNGCELYSPNIHLIDAFVWNTLIRFPIPLRAIVNQLQQEKSNLDSSDHLTKITSIKDEIKKLVSRESRLVLLFETERIELDEYDKRKSEIQSKFANLNAELEFLQNELDDEPSLIKEIQETLEKLDNPVKYLIDLSPKEKRAILLEIVKNIIVTWNPDINAHIVQMEFNIDNIALKSTLTMPRGSNFKQKLLSGEFVLAKDFLPPTAVKVDFANRFSRETAA